MSVIYGQDLYPPIVEPIQPVPVSTEKDAYLISQRWEIPEETDEFGNLVSEKDHLRIYFSLSPYLGEWKVLDESNPTAGGYWIQTTITDQRTNKTVLQAQAWPYGITIPSRIWRPEDNNNDGESQYRYNNELYRYDIYHNDINDPSGQGEQEFVLGKYYRIQARIIFLSGSWESAFSYAFPDWTQETPMEEKWYDALSKICQMNLDTLNTDSKYSDVNVAVSEWSTITLEKLITRPDVYIRNLTAPYGVDPYDKDKAKDDRAYNPAELCKIANLSQKQLKVPTQLLEIIGQFSVGEDNGEVERIKYVSMNLEYLESDVYHTVEQSGQLLVNGDNSFYYKFRTLLDKVNHENDYWLHVVFETINGYWEELKFQLVLDFNEGTGGLNLTCTTNKECGWVDLTVTPAPSQELSVMIIRSDSRSNFKLWDELFCVDTDGIHEVGARDVTAEYGVWYEYALQTVTEDGVRGSVQNVTSPIIMDSDRIFLVNSDGQLSISFNSQVSSVRYNIQESKTETLGSRFPWIRRNAAVRYRSFSLGATISYNDNNENFLTSFADTDLPDYSVDNLNEVNINRGFKDKSDLFHPAVLPLYNYYNAKEKINDYNDILLEREYRAEVIKFLQSGHVFLFKSPAEGNILVRLIDFSFSPKGEINNLVYDFSCEGNEIDDATVKNYDKYDIQFIGQHMKKVSYYPYSTTIEKRGSI